MKKLFFYFIFFSLFFNIEGNSDEIGKRMYELANEPKYSYFSEYDDHMMEYNEKLLKTLKDFISSLN